MSRIHEAFENKKAFIPFITCGDPDLETTAAIVKAMVHNGADLIELGIPFSDPTAEGPVIQAANIRALSGDLVDHRRNHAARAAPRRPEIQQHLLFGFEHFVMEIILANLHRSHMSSSLRDSFVFRMSSLLLVTV